MPRFLGPGRVHLHQPYKPNSFPGAVSEILQVLVPTSPQLYYLGLIYSEGKESSGNIVDSHQKQTMMFTLKRMGDHLQFLMTIHNIS